MTTPSHDELLDAWIELGGDAQAVRDLYNLSPRQLRDFASDPDVQKHIAAWSDLCERGARLQSLRAQQAAARALESSLSHTSDPVETRRIATVLIRVARDMLAPTKRRALTEPAAPARVLEGIQPNQSPDLSTDSAPPTPSSNTSSALPHQPSTLLELKPTAAPIPTNTPDTLRDASDHPARRRA